MDAKRMVPEDPPELGPTSRTTASRGGGTKRAALFAAGSLVATALPVVIVIVVLNVDVSHGMFGALLWLGIACAVVAIILGGNGRAAAARYSGLRDLSTIGVVLGVIELVGMVAFTLFALVLREAAGDWFQM